MEFEQLIKNGHNILITGFPGTGKSQTLATIIDSVIQRGKKVSATASTGKAAVVLREALQKLNIYEHACVTVHKLFGILDGRYTNDEVVSVMNTDEKYENKRRVILDTDVIIIDEISMISKKTFEQVEYISRSVKQNNKPFGGIQMVLCGDFYQLPPVPSPHYGDDGSYMFSSNLIDFFHHVDLTTVHRQKDADLSRAIREVANGQLEKDSSFLLGRLGRSLPPGDPPVHLYGNNLGVDIHNAQCFMDLKGDEMVYRCEDEGDTENMRVKKVVHLKKSCPVILNVNLSDELVNGLTGTVIEMKQEGVNVYFPTLNRNVLIGKYIFTKYSVLLKRDIGSRKQIPLDLGYALTVHKSQGLTLSRVSVQCRNMRQYGQITVALSRTTCKKDLQIKNFRPEHLIKPPPEIINFYDRQPVCIEDTLQCCRNVMNFENKCDGSVDDDKVKCGDADNGDDLSDIDTDDDDEIVKTLMDIEVLATSQNTKELPDNVNIQQILEEVKNSMEKTEQQIKENEIIRLLANQDGTKPFVTYLFNSISALLESMSSESLTNKEIHLFYREYNSLVTSADHQFQIRYLFGRNPTAAHHNVIGKISTKIRNYLIHQKAEPCRKKLETEAMYQTDHHEFKESKEGRGKIRYIAGWCIHSLLKKSKQNITGSLYNKDRVKDTERFILQRQLLESIRAESRECQNQPSLIEISRKQNIGGGLFIVNDSAAVFLSYWTKN